MTLLILGMLVSFFLIVYLHPIGKNGIMDWEEYNELLRAGYDTISQEIYIKPKKKHKKRKND